MILFSIHKLQPQKDGLINLDRAWLLNIDLKHSVRPRPRTFSLAQPFTSNQIPELQAWHGLGIPLAAIVASNLNLTTTHAPLIEHGH